MVVMVARKGIPSIPDLEGGLQRSFQVNWECKVKELDGGRFVVKFPNMEVLNGSWGLMNSLLE
jgi:hypothetical protein